MDFSINKSAYTQQAWNVIMLARQEALSGRVNELDAEHLVMGMLKVERSLLRKILEQLEVDINSFASHIYTMLNSKPKVSIVNAQALLATTKFKQVLDGARTEAERLKDELVSEDHLLLSLTQLEAGGVAEVMGAMGITNEKVYRELQKVRGSARVTDERAESRYNALSKYGVDLTAMARDGKLDPVVGRDMEIRRMMQTLTRRTKNNPVLIGDAGVGKTAVAEGLAQRIVAGDVPSILQQRRVIALQLSTLMAGTSLRGEFEERMNAVLDEVKGSKGEIILFIDEIHMMVGAGAVSGGTLDASNIMKPALARGELQTIGSTTPDEYRKHIEMDSALERRFSPIWLEEPSRETAVTMLRTLRPRYEKHHGLKIADGALETAVDLSSRYITDRFLPDKAVDLIDEAASKIRIQNDSMPPELRRLEAQMSQLEDEERASFERDEYELSARKKEEHAKLKEEHDRMRSEWLQNATFSDEITPNDIALLIAERTGIPVTNLVEDELGRFEKFEERLHERIVGQEQAITAVADAVRRSRTGLHDPKRPLGSFIFIGPTGVGKTELARTLTELLFDHEDNMVRVDMSEYQEQHSVSRLLGAPPGYVGHDAGGQLTEQVRRRPYSVVLFDEIEKAHPKVFDTLLQVLDDGRLTDGMGRTVNFKNTVIIMTSNAGSGLIKNAAPGFISSDAGFNREKLRSDLRDALRKEFRPEFLNRVDEVVVFDPLTQEQVITIADKLVEGLQRRLGEMEVSVEITPRAKRWLAQKGYDPEYGVRPLKRLIQREVENRIANMVVAKKAQAGDTLKFDLKGDALAVQRA